MVRANDLSEDALVLIASAFPVEHASIVDAAPAFEGFLADAVRCVIELVEEDLRARCLIRTISGSLYDLRAIKNIYLSARLGIDPP